MTFRVGYTLYVREEVEDLYEIHNDAESVNEIIHLSVHSRQAGEV